MIFDFAFPLAFLLLLLVAAYVIIMLRRRPRAGVVFSNVPQVLKASGAKRSNAHVWLVILRTIGLVLLVVALARPRFGQETREIQTSGIDIMLAVDVSGSMLALDLELEGQPVTRLEVVKDVIGEFISRRPTDRIGIIAFGSDPYLLSPLTLDHDWLRQNLERLEVGMIEAGTSIGPPIGMATNRLRQLEDAKSRILILLTDGEDSVPPAVSPTRFAEAAAAFGIKIYTVAVGRGGVVHTYVLNRNNELARDRLGRPVVQRAQFPVDEELLREIAEAGGGRFFVARNRYELEKIYEEIDRLEKTEVKLRFRTEYREAYFWPLVGGLLLLLIEQLLAMTKLRRIP